MKFLPGFGDTDRPYVGAFEDEVSEKMCARPAVIGALQALSLCRVLGENARSKKHHVVDFIPNFRLHAGFERVPPAENFSLSLIKRRRAVSQ